MPAVDKHYGFVTVTGISDIVVVFIPSGPELLPQQKAWPPATAQLTLRPALMAVTVRPAKTPLVVTATGTSELAKLLLPSSPLTLLPQQKAWSSATAQL